MRKGEKKENGTKSSTTQKTKSLVPSLSLAGGDGAAHAPEDAAFWGIPLSRFDFARHMPQADCTTSTDTRVQTRPRSHGRIWCHVASHVQTSSLRLAFSQRTVSNGRIACRPRVNLSANSRSFRIVSHGAHTADSASCVAHVAGLNRGGKHTPPLFENTRALQMVTSAVISTRVQTLHVPGSPQTFDLAARWENDASSDAHRASGEGGTIL